MRRHDRLVDLHHQHLVPDLFPEGRVAVLDEATFAGDGLDHTLVFQFRVGLGDGITVDAELHRQWPDRREGIAGPELAGSGGGADLVDDLEIDRLAGFKIELDQHSGLTVL